MTSQLQAILVARALRRRPSPDFAPIAWVVATLHAWRRRAKERAALAALDDRLLDDIGITRAQARAEVDKPFWRS
ncbi:MAG: DUF1127 domain-containing protein [Gammaproteobacteria bacterium]|nr:DUF1127 domain-containing protein [Gammaproteobacteria bacterium]